MPKPKLDDSVSLFPFLDIMASLIGILVLLITAATLAQIGQTVEDTADAQAVAKAKARIVRYRAVKKRLTTDTREQQRLQELVEQAAGVGDQHRLGHAEPADPAWAGLGEGGFDDRGAHDRHGHRRHARPR